MNKIVLSFLALLCCINIQAGVKLQKQGSATQLVVNDKPMLLLAGELSNSVATSPADISKALKQMKNSGANSVFVPAYWEFVEPNEGKYDFALVGIGYVDQVEVDKNGKLQFIRRDNGDQDHQGRHARISCGDNKYSTSSYTNTKTSIYNKV